ncbi:MAG: hypothetical protein ACFCU6_14755, partial [Balneolaceae bacterium]
GQQSAVSSQQSAVSSQQSAVSSQQSENFKFIDLESNYLCGFKMRVLIAAWDTPLVCLKCPLGISPSHFPSREGMFLYLKY